MEHTPPPRYGDWSSANRHLTAGGTVEGIVRDNPYREYYLSLHKKNMICYKDKTFCASTVDEHTCGRELSEEDKIDAKMKALPIAYGNFCEDNPCGKPEMEDEQIRKAIETLKQSKVVGEVGTILSPEEWTEVYNKGKSIFDNPCGKPHNNGEETCNECLIIKEVI